MSYPGFIRRLFANEGADPLLRKEIIPFGDTEGTVCALPAALTGLSTRRSC